MTSNRVSVDFPPSKDQKAIPPALPSGCQYVDLHQILFGQNPVEIDPATVILENHEQTKTSCKRNGIIKAYAANTN